MTARRPLAVLAIVALAGTLLASIVPVAAATTTVAIATVPPTVKFGMESSSVSAQEAAGVKPDYGTFWIGPWTLSSGWAGPDGQLTNMKNAGVTPAVHFYYWGDDISPSCVETGCWSSLHNAQKDRAGWQLLAQQMVDHFNSKMGGALVLVFLESEFNKGGIETYEPFDGYLADMAAFIHTKYPASTVVLGFGNWGSVYWGNFDRAAAASDMVGIQGMRGSTRQTVDQMYSLYDGLLTGIKALEAKFPGKAKMITDMAVSSYPEPDYLAVQAGVLGEVFDNMATLKANGVQAVIYRSWRDSPTMNTANYYGMAERYWGLSNSAGAKPSQAVWVDGVKAERAATVPPPPPPPEPAAVSVPEAGGTFEVDAFAVRSAGGAQSDAQASGAKMWNLWSNGHVAQTFNVAAGDYVVTVRARGTLASAIAPHMDVSLAGTPLLAADPTAAYANHQATRTLSGLVELGIAFGNDAKTATEDRNLIVDTVTFTRVFPNQPPVAAFQATAAGPTLTVDASASMDPDGESLAYAWSFGDAVSATGAQASHAYTVSGMYTVTLTVTDPRGATASATKIVTVTVPVEVGEDGATVEVDGMPTRTAGGAQSDAQASGGRMWNLWSNGHVAQTFAVAPGDYTIAVQARGTTASGIGPHMDLTVNGVRVMSADPGAGYGLHTATVTLSGTADVRIAFTNDVRTSTEDRNLILDTLAITRVPPNQPPVAACTTTLTGSVLTANASASTDPDGDALSFAWDFGDGTAATGAVVGHTFAAPGTYAVTLTVTDTEGASSSMAAEVTVAPPPDAIALGVHAYKVKGYPRADLTWTGATSTNVDIYVNGVRLATTANDGAFTDARNVRGGGTRDYQVCVAGTSTCSNHMIVAF